MWLKQALLVVFYGSLTLTPFCSIAQYTDFKSDDQQAFIIQVNDRFDFCALEQFNAHLGARINDIITVYLPNNVDVNWNEINGIMRVEVPRKIRPEMDRSILDMRVDSVYQGHKLESGYTGKDVLIGITDWGFDYSHPNFHDTSLSQTRIEAAWDQFKIIGPRPKNYLYGTEYSTPQEILDAKSDTAGLYDYAYHGSHVAGIAGGNGAGTDYRGVAFEAKFLMVSLRLDEAAAIDAFAWMKEKADALDKRLVVNMSWGLYHIGSMDGTGLLSQAIDDLSDQGVIFITSAGNNGGETFHVSKTFDADTMHTGIGFYTFSYPLLWGQSISMWGEPGEIFNVELLILNNSNEVIHISPTYNTTNELNYFDTLLVFGNDTVFYNISVTSKYMYNDRPTMRLSVRERSSELKVALRSYAQTGTVHYWNVVELTNDAGNWGGTFEDWKPGWLSGNDEYSLGDPASTKSVIAVGAHSSEVRLQNGNVVGGRQATFTSKGPTLDGRRKPEISAPGVNVASSISSYTTRNFTELTSVDFNGRQYPFARLSGTSMASPAVTGVVALMLQANPGLTYIDVKEILKQTARLDNNTGDIRDTSDLSWGWGKVNASRAVQMAEAWVPVAPVLENEHLKLFPNPVSNMLYFGSIEPKSIAVYSMLGELVLKGDVGYIKGINVSHLASGTYVVRFNDDIVVPQKLIIL
ncbi:MAG: minor extracellular serine protease Vpr [Bacteroidia bacterium]|jgi:minor extracellular serine protease Vpr